MKMTMLDFLKVGVKNSKTYLVTISSNKDESVLTRCQAGNGDEAIKKTASKYHVLEKDLKAYKITH